ncbi:30S ribosome-binding factor RbfA [Candidatus Omnitrophota bacterium]
MSSARLERVAEQIKKEISVILQEELNDPRIGFVTLTKVELTPDLRQAKVYFSHLGSEKELKDTQVGLKRSAGFIRRLIGQRIRIRYTPEIIFKLDQNIEHGIQISEILDKIKEQDKQDE